MTVRNEVVQFKVNKDERARLIGWSQEARVSLSEYIRVKLFGLSGCPMITQKIVKSLSEGSPNIVSQLNNIMTKNVSGNTFMNGKKQFTPRLKNK